MVNFETAIEEIVAWIVIQISQNPTTVLGVQIRVPRIRIRALIPIDITSHKNNSQNGYTKEEWLPVEEKRENAESEREIVLY